MESLLLQAIHDALRAGQDPIDAMRVYGDWLQSRGSPHGNLIALGCALADTRDDDVAAMRLMRSFKQSCRALGPTLFGYSLDDVSGFSAALPCGFLRWLRVDITQVSPELLGSVLSRPASAFLKDVTFGGREVEEQPILVGPFLEALRPCEHISKLSIEGCRLDKTDAMRIAELPNLRSLNLKLSVLASDILGHEWLPRLERLQSLTLKLLPPVDVHGHLTALPTLEKLNIKFKEIDANELSVLDDDSTLESLSAHRHLELVLDEVDWPEICYRRLASITSLQKLTLSFLDFNQATAHALEPAQNLDSLRISHTESGCDLKSLPALPGLRRLDLSSNNWLTGAALACLERSPNLEELEISECESFDGQAIVHVANLCNLQVLNLWNCHGLQPGDFSILRQLNELRELELGELPGVSTRDLTIISELPHLQVCSLCDLPCEEALFDAITSCHGLRSLSLRSCTFDEDWLIKLTTLPALTHLSLPRSLTKDTLTRLRDAMPACQIRVSSC